MAFKHGKNTYISLGGVNLSTFTTTSEIDRTVDTPDVTTYGKDSHCYDATLLDGTGSLDGIYDDTATTGPRAAITAMLGTKVTLIRRPEGTGVGLPQDSVDAIIKGYKETNPVADMIKWVCTLQLSDDVDTTAQ